MLTNLVGHKHPNHSPITAKPTMRVLAVCAASTLDTALRADEQGLGPVEELLHSCPNGSVKVLYSPTVEEIKLQLKMFAPTLVYLAAGYQQHKEDRPPTLNSLILQHAGSSGRPAAIGPTQLSSMFTDSSVQTVFFNAAASEVNATSLVVKANIPHAMYWPRTTTPHALVASHFARIFFAFLCYDSITIEEAFAIATHAAQVHFACLQSGTLFPPLLARLYSATPPTLPGPASVPPPALPGVVGEQGSVLVSGWEDVVLLAPSAEVKVSVCGRRDILDVHRVGHLAEALRALLALEARTLTVTSISKAESVPSHVPEGLAAVVCTCTMASGVTVRVVLGAPDAVIQHQALVQHALRCTLMTDALSLQFVLPGPGQSLPPPRITPTDVPTIDLLLHTSVWAASILKALPGNPQYRPLIALGVAGVGSGWVAGYTAADGRWWKHVVHVAGDVVYAAPPEEEQVPVESLLADEDPLQGLMLDTYGTSGRQYGGGGREAFILEYPRQRIVWQSNRPPLEQCDEHVFYDDLVAFLCWYKGMDINRYTFPDTILNGRPLDLFNLYRQVVMRGGIRVGTRINWKGHIFERIRNYTADNKATAVGHALKKHYQNFLLDYEAANPRDLCRDLCIICHERNVPMQHDFDPQQPIGGASLQAAAPNWIACDVCGRKSHFSCDVRPGLATYDEYMAAKVAAPGGGGPMYSCILCSAAEGLEVLRGCAPGYVPPVQEGGAADGADGCGADGAAPMEQE